MYHSVFYIFTMQIIATAANVTIQHNKIYNLLLSDLIIK